MPRKPAKTLDHWEAHCPRGHAFKDAATLPEPVSVTSAVFAAAHIEAEICLLYCSACNYQYGVVTAPKKIYPNLPDATRAQLAASPTPLCPNGHGFEFQHVGITVKGGLHDHGFPVVVFCHECGHTYGALLMNEKRGWF